VLELRLIFHFHKHESVCVVMCGLGHLDFIYLFHKMRVMFIRKDHNSANDTVKFFTGLLTISQDFMKLCNVIDIDAMYFYKVSFGKLIDSFISILLTRVYLGVQGFICYQLSFEFSVPDVLSQLRR